jgi:hypothetical protein
MKLKMFTMALLVSALPYSASAKARLEPGDFVHEERIREGETELKVKLSKSGKAKLRRAAQSQA